MSHINVLDLLKCSLINSIMNGTKSNVIILENHFFSRDGILWIGYLNFGLHHFSHLSID
jgi:hypothetical protein